MARPMPAPSPPPRPVCGSSGSSSSSEPRIKWRVIPIRTSEPRSSRSCASGTCKESSMRYLIALTRLRCQRGIALPMALMILMILSVLIAAFSMLAASEPVLAANQLQVAQARAVAESGLERAIWALNNPGDPSGIPNPLVTAAAPYDGSTAVPVFVNGAQVGTFTVSVTNGAAPNERNVVATALGVAGSGSVLKAKQKITATVYQIRFLDPPAAL